jgi:hypothetical protein
MGPYAVVPSLGCLVIHISGLAAHTRNLQARWGRCQSRSWSNALDPVYQLPDLVFSGERWVQC